MCARTCARVRDARAPPLTRTGPSACAPRRYVLKAKKWNEAARLAVHWAAFLAFLPAKVVFGGVWLSGLITATIVTVTHQSE